MGAQGKLAPEMPKRAPKSHKRTQILCAYSSMQNKLKNVIFMQASLKSSPQNF